MKRRDFIKYGAGGLAAIAIGCKKDSSSNPPPQSSQTFTPAPSWAEYQNISLTFTDAVKHMVTDNAINPATNYFWIFKASTPTFELPAESPGPIIFAVEGDVVNLTLTNALPQNHQFTIPAAGIFGPILPPGALNVPFSFTVPRAGTYLYYDPLNAPVNRVMGLHGAFVVMPNPTTGAPYNSADLSGAPQVARLFADLGTAAWFPGLAWGQGSFNPDPFPPTPAFRQYI